MIKNIKKEAENLEKILMNIRKFRKQAPDGYLKYQKKGNEMYFYQHYMNLEINEWEKRYIKKDNISLAKDLAQKQYYAKLEPLLEKNQKLINDFIRKYHPEEMEQIYDDLNEMRKKLVRPVFVSKEEIIHRWNIEEYESNPFHPENLRFETQQGEMVRSKSEVIISNILYSYKTHILYKYERPLRVEKEGNAKIIYPDFTILNINTGKITYWEHAGRIDDSYYANEFVKKINTYVSNDLLPGRDVLVTYETMSNPLDVSVVKRMVEEICV